MGKVSQQFANVTDTSYYDKLSKVLEMVSDITDVPKEHIKGRHRLREAVDARRIYAVLCRLHLGLQFQLIGRYVKRNHASILYYVGQHDILIKSDARYRRNYNSAEQILLSNFSSMTRTKSFLDLLVQENIELREKVKTLNDRMDKLEKKLTRKELKKILR
jgi:hypothetical protein|tara:strand:- start:6639 stop:7121 length:483 start_codon:yes stop_codon:yes gene_type:complete